MLGPLIKKVIEKGALNLDLNPKLIYQKLITGATTWVRVLFLHHLTHAETEIRTGKPSDLPRNVSEEQAMKNPDVQKAVTEHLAVTFFLASPSLFLTLAQELQSVCTLFLDGIISSRDKLPYGLRWICKALKLACEAQFPDATQEDIHRLLGYFLYYRFINIAIVAPDTFGLVETKEISPEIRGGLTDVAKVLQNLFNLLLFTDPDKAYMFCVNDFITECKKKVEAYLDRVVDVKDPEEVTAKRGGSCNFISENASYSFSRWTSTMSWCSALAPSLSSPRTRLFAFTPWWRSTWLSSRLTRTTTFASS